MNTSKQWIDYFTANAKHQRIDWKLAPSISIEELTPILPSLQAWQLGETSDGSNLIRASSLYAKRIGDPDYVAAVKLFIKEEQKHGNNLGRYLDAIHQPRIGHDWGDTLFRKVRHFNTSMELWTLTVITVESAAQVFYQCLKDASDCALLKQVCTDILIDEAWHIDFQMERLSILFRNKSAIQRVIFSRMYTIFYSATVLVIWLAHKRAFKSGGVNRKEYLHKMRYKYLKTIHRIVSFNPKWRNLQTPVYEDCSTLSA